MGKLRGAWAGLSQMRGNFILSEFIFPRRVRLLRPQTSKVFGGYTREVVDWAPPHIKHSAVELNWGQHLSILQTNFESDFVVNATAAERPTVKKYNTKITGHIRINKILKFITWNFWWPGIAHLICNYIRNYYKCQCNKAPRHAPAGLL